MVPESPYSGLNVEKWLRLLAHTALLRANTRALGDLIRLKPSALRVRSAVSDLAMAADAAGRSAQDESQAVSATCDRWCERLDALLANTSANQERALLEELRHNAPDAVAVDPFRLLLDAVTSRAAEIYGACWRPPAFDVGWLPAHPRPAGHGDPYTITAYTKPGSTPTVELLIYLDGFGPAAYAVIPWLMVHECICHVAARQGGEVDNSSPFAEGFMDWAASHFFDMWMDGVNELLAPTARIEAGKVDHFLTPEGTSEAAARCYGRQAAEVIATWLAAERGFSRTEVQNRVAIMAIRLNCVDEPLAVKDALVSIVNRGHASWPSDLVSSLSTVLEADGPVPDAAFRALLQTATRLLA